MRASVIQECCCNKTTAPKEPNWGHPSVSVYEKRTRLKLLSQATVEHGCLAAVGCTASLAHRRSTAQNQAITSPANRPAPSYAKMAFRLELHRMMKNRHIPFCSYLLGILGL